jgi:hypothetical protein
MHRSRGRLIFVLDPSPTLFFSLARMSEAVADAGRRSAESIDTLSERAEEVLHHQPHGPDRVKRKLHPVKRQHVRDV